MGLQKTAYVGLLKNRQKLKKNREEKRLDVLCEKTLNNYSA